MGNDKCDLCESYQIHILKKSAALGPTTVDDLNNVDHYCPKCDKVLIPKEFQFMTQREISMLELKKELAEMVAPVVEKIESFILWLEKPLQWMVKHQIRIYQAFIIVMIVLCLFSYHLSKNSLNLSKKILNDKEEIIQVNKLLIQANNSLLESNDYLIDLNEQLINRLYYDFGLSSPDSVSHEILDSIYNKVDHLEDSI